jgi:PIN domain nuclease of toxin-antitoxin system
MTTVLLDTNVMYWIYAQPEQVSRPARRAVDRADERAVSAISWWELAWLVRSGRIALSMPLRSWFEELTLEFRTVAISPAIAETAASLPATFPKDPPDRLIYATALENGWQLITRDERMHQHRHPRQITIW